MSDALAVSGGPRAVPEDLDFRVWPEVTREDEEMVLSSLHQDKHAFGTHAQALERELAAWNGNAHCFASNSGTAALRMCVAGCGIGPGDEVVTTSLSCDMDPILDSARRHNLALIEDGCQAVGATYTGRTVGTMGHAAAFSLNQNKNFTGGEGGLFVTDDESLFKKGKAVSAFSDMRPPEAGREFDDFGLGCMYRTSNLPAAFALSQLSRLDVPVEG